MRFGMRGNDSDFRAGDIDFYRRGEINEKYIYNDSVDMYGERG